MTEILATIGLALLLCIIGLLNALSAMGFVVLATVAFGLPAILAALWHARLPWRRAI